MKDTTATIASSIDAGLSLQVVGALTLLYLVLHVLKFTFCAGMDMVRYLFGRRPIAAVPVAAPAPVAAAAPPAMPAAAPAASAPAPPVIPAAAPAPAMPGAPVGEVEQAPRTPTPAGIIAGLFISWTYLNSAHPLLDVCVGFCFLGMAAMLVYFTYTVLEMVLKPVWDFFFGRRPTPIIRPGANVPEPEPAPAVVPPAVRNNKQENEPFCRLLGLAIDQMDVNRRANGSVLALGLPPDLTWNEFQTHYADAVGTRDTKIQERARYFQLYKAFDREEGECMDMILRAKREQVLAF